MKIKHILSLIIAVGTAATICGCQGELCPEARQLEDEAQSVELEPHIRLERLKATIDNYRQCRQAKAKSKSARMTIDKDLEDLTHRFASLKLAQIGQWPTRTVAQCTEVISELERILGYDDPNEGIRGALAQYRAKKQKLMQEVNRLLSKAADKRYARQWQEAVSLVDDALAVDPENEEARRMRREVISERDAHYKRAIQELCEGEIYDSCKKAESLLKAFKAEKPDPDRDLVADLQGLIERTKAKVAEQLIGQKKYFTAYTLVKDVNTPKCQDLLDIIVAQGGAFYMALANEEYRNVRDFHAYAAAVKAMELLGSDNDHAFKLHRDCADRVDDSIQIKIGIAVFESTGDEPDIGTTFSNELLSHLHPLLPYGIEIEERKKIEFGIEKVGSKEAVRLLGLKWAVFGDMQCKVVRERDERQVTTWSPVSKTIPNPHYETELKIIMESDKHSSTWPKPQPTITTKVSEKVTYKVGEERLHGQLVCSARVYSGSEGYIISPRTFTATRDAKDLFQDEAPAANIARDPLELPPQLMFVQQMLKEMVKQVGDWLLSNFGQRQRRFCEEAEYFVQRKELDHAVRAACQGYLYCLRDNVAEDDRWFRRLRQIALFDLTEGYTH